MAVEPSTASLARFAAGLRFEDIPAPVVRRAEDLALDWAAAAIAGRTGPPVEAMAALSRAMGPDSGPAEVLPGRRTTSALLAAMENAAASHYHELDAIHNRSVLHPATVVLPAALALAQAEGRSGRDLLAAIVAGFEVGIRVGEYLGRSHYQRFHTTATAGTLAAAAAAGRAIGLAEGPMLDALGSAGTLAAGLWEFLPSGADSKPLHTGHAASAGVSGRCSRGRAGWAR
jgi:2-methylcitrate dehydratase PrpD